MNAWDDVWLMQRIPSCGVGLTASPGEAWTTMGQGPGGMNENQPEEFVKATMLEFISLWFNLDLFFFFFTCVCGNDKFFHLLEPVDHLKTGIVLFFNRIYLF